MATTGTGGTEGTTHHLAHEWDGERSLGERIVDAVAEHGDADDPAALPPLADSVDPAALDALFASTADDEPRPGCVTFSYGGYTVVVQSTGRVLLRRE